MRTAKAGFTLVELLVAAAASLILSGVTLMGLVTFQQMSQQMDERLVQEAELRRALHLIATDIQEGKRIQAGAPPRSVSVSRSKSRSVYSPVFQSIRPDGSSVSYYTTKRGGLIWAGPQILYRWDSREKLAYALVDQIADVDGVNIKPSDVCTGVGTLVSNKTGVVVWIDGQSTAKVCLLGHLAKSKTGAKASIIASTRVAP
jgi:prepilin-type N-terminal cleavage/methylation domain-containing protein